MPKNLLEYSSLPCLYTRVPGERSAVGPFCLSQYPRQAEVRVTAGSNAGAMPSQRNTWRENVQLTMVCLRLIWPSVVDKGLRHPIETKVRTLVNIKG